MSVGDTQQQQPYVGNHEARLRRFYEVYCPEKIENIPVALFAFAGREDEMFAKLVKKYGPEPLTSDCGADDVIIPMYRTTPPPAVAHPPTSRSDEDQDTRREYSDNITTATPTAAVVAAARSDRDGTVNSQHRVQQEALQVDLCAVRQRLVWFYLEYAPHKILNKVDDVMIEYRGREDEMFCDLEKHYGKEPNISERRARLKAFYAYYAPEKIPMVDDIMFAYAGEEDTLFDLLVEKYGGEPRELLSSSGVAPDTSAEAEVEKNDAAARDAATKRRLDSFYRHYAPEKLSIVGELIEFYGEKATKWKLSPGHVDLFRILEAKYGPEPAKLEASAAIALRHSATPESVQSLNPKNDFQGVAEDLPITYPNEKDELRNGSAPSGAVEKQRQQQHSRHHPLSRSGSSSSSAMVQKSQITPLGNERRGRPERSATIVTPPPPMISVMAPSEPCSTAYASSHHTSNDPQRQLQQQVGDPQQCWEEEEQPQPSQPPQQLSYRDRVANIYTFYAPEKLHSVDAVVRMYAGREDQMIELLTAKFGAEPTPQDLADLMRVATAVQAGRNFKAQVVASEEQQMPAADGELDDAREGGGSRHPAQRISNRKNALLSTDVNDDEPSTDLSQTTEMLMSGLPSSLRRQQRKKPVQFNYRKYLAECRITVSPILEYELGTLEENVGTLTFAEVVTFVNYFYITSSLGTQIEDIQLPKEIEQIDRHAFEFVLAIEGIVTLEASRRKSSVCTPREHEFLEIINRAQYSIAAIVAREALVATVQSESILRDVIDANQDLEWQHLQKEIESVMTLDFEYPSSLRARGIGRTNSLWKNFVRTVCREDASALTLCSASTLAGGVRPIELVATSDDTATLVLPRNTDKAEQVPSGEALLERVQNSLRNRNKHPQFYHYYAEHRAWLKTAKSRQRESGQQMAAAFEALVDDGDTDEAAELAKSKPTNETPLKVHHQHSALATGAAARTPPSQKRPPFSLYFHRRKIGEGVGGQRLLQLSPSEDTEHRCRHHVHRERIREDAIPGATTSSRVARRHDRPVNNSTSHHTVATFTSPAVATTSEKCKIAGRSMEDNAAVEAPTARPKISNPTVLCKRRGAFSEQLVARDKVPAKSAVEWLAETRPAAATARHRAAAMQFFTEEPTLSERIRQFKAKVAVL